MKTWRVKKSPKACSYVYFICTQKECCLIYLYVERVLLQEIQFRLLLFLCFLISHGTEIWDTEITNLHIVEQILFFFCHLLRLELDKTHAQVCICFKFAGILELILVSFYCCFIRLLQPSFTIFLPPNLAPLQIYMKILLKLYHKSSRRNFSFET